MNEEEKKIADAKAEEDRKAAANKQQTLDEILDDEATKTGKTEVAETVPLNVFLELKDEIKELKRQIKEGDGSTKSEDAEKIKELQDKYGDDVPKEMIADMFKAMKGNAATTATKDPTLDKILQNQEKQDKITKSNDTKEKLKKLYDRAIEISPEYKDIADMNLIMKLANDPENRHKTMGDLLVDTYSKFVTGRKTLETSQSGHGRTVEDVDFGNMDEDTEKHVLSGKDKKLTEKYNEWAIGKIRF